MLFSLMWSQNWENVAVLGLLLYTFVKPDSKPRILRVLLFFWGVSAVSHCWMRWLEAFVHMLTRFYAACCSHKAPGDGPKHARLTEGSGEFPNLVFEQERKRRGCRRDQALAGGCAQRSAQQGGGAQMWLTSLPSLPTSAHQLMSYNNLCLFSF